MPQRRLNRGCAPLHPKRKFSGVDGTQAKGHGHGSRRRVQWAPPSPWSEPELSGTRFPATVCNAAVVSTAEVSGCLFIFLTAQQQHQQTQVGLVCAGDVADQGRTITSQTQVLGRGRTQAKGHGHGSSGRVQWAQPSPFNGHRHRRGLNPSYLAPDFRPRFARSAGFNCRGFWFSVYFSYSNDNNKKFRSTKGMADKYETERQAGPPNATAMKRVDLLVALLELCHGAGKPPKRTIGQKRCVQVASQGGALLSALQCPLWGRGCDLIKKQTNANQR